MNLEKRELNINSNSLFSMVVITEIGYLNNDFLNKIHDGVKKDYTIKLYKQI